MRTNHVKTAAAFLVPLAAVSFSGCGTDQKSSPPPYQPDTPAVVLKAELATLRNPSHQALANAMRELDSSLMETLNSTSYATGYTARHPTDTARIPKLVQSIDSSQKEILAAISASNDKGDQLLFIQFAKSLGEARAALEFTRATGLNATTSIPDGSYHTLHGLLFQSRALMRALQEPQPVEVFGK